jgi:hypothetical protein
LNSRLTAGSRGWLQCHEGVSQMWLATTGPVAAEVRPNLAGVSIGCGGLTPRPTHTPVHGQGCQATASCDAYHVAACQISMPVSRHDCVLPLTRHRAVVRRHAADGGCMLWSGRHLRVGRVAVSISSAHQASSLRLLTTTASSKAASGSPASTLPRPPTSCADLQL